MTVGTGERTLVISRREALAGIAGAAALAGGGGVARAAEGATSLLNVSYDVGRELFAAIDAAFVEAYAARTGARVEVRQSHGGSSAQARAVLEGLEADVVTLNQITDLQMLQERGSGLVAA